MSLELKNDIERLARMNQNLLDDMSRLRLDYQEKYLECQKLQGVAAKLNDKKEIIKKLYKDFIQLAKQAAEVRRIQKEYFRTRIHSVMLNSKAKEKDLDKQLLQILEQHEAYERAKVSPKLFD